MALKPTLAEFRRRMLNRPREGDRSSSPKSVGSGEPVFTPASDEAAPVVHPLKKQKSKKAAKEKAMVTDLEGLPSLKERLDIHVIDKDFPYPDFMDKELIVPALLGCLEGDDENLAAKFQWPGRAMLKLAALL